MKTVSQTKTFTIALAYVLFSLGVFARAQSAAVLPRTRAAGPAMTESVRAGKVIAPDGGVALTSIDRKWDRASGTGTVNESAVTPEGKVSTRAANLTREADGTIVEKGTFTDFDGHSANYTETTRRTAKGSVIVGQMVDETGRAATYETTSARAGRNQTRLTTVITYADGAKITRIEILGPAKPIAGT